jgi:CheY-like chemotaxis protein
MDKVTASRCIEPFFTTKGMQGTGLGLPMVHGIVQRHGGNMQIKSEPGVGTTVQMQFPVPVEMTSTEDNSEKAPEPLSALRILVVDDEARSRNLVARFLKADGHAVETAKDGQEGVEMFGQGEFDLVITDRAMPLMRGDEVVAEITKKQPGLPVIMLTGFGDIMKDKGECPPGVTRVMSKPVTSKDLRHVMARVMRAAK